MFRYSTPVLPGQGTFHFLILLLVLLSPWGELQAAIPDSQEELLQFTSGGHVLGFKSDGLYVASGDHAMHVGFDGASGVVPEAPSADAVEGKAPPLTKVTYTDLWPGISLRYEAVAGGIAESTWEVAAGADAKQIRLRYNAPVEVEKNGNLKIHYETGWMRESAPIAWQEIDGHRQPVEVAFHLLGDSEHKPIISFEVGHHNPAHPLLIDPTLEWNTFIQVESTDYGDAGYGIAVDGSGNIYVIGGLNNGRGIFVAKLDSVGTRQWHTFMGSAGDGRGNGIAVDGSGNIYVTGESWATWGSPVNPYSGRQDAFIAKLDDTGALQWNTFMGSSEDEYGQGIALDGSGNIYVVGSSDATWGSPVNPYTGNPYTGGDYYDAFVAKLDDTGALQWNTFMGSSNYDHATDISIDGSGNIYVTGSSADTWGSPVNLFAGGLSDAFVAKLDDTGALQWNTFMGSWGTDFGQGIALDGSGNIYVTGDSTTTWGTPVNYIEGQRDEVFVAKLDSGGTRQWHTFMGSLASDDGYGIALDGSGDIYVTGRSGYTGIDTPWGTTPVNPHSGGEDAFVAKLDSVGTRQWHTFMGSSYIDAGFGIAVDGRGNIYVTGESTATWGSPVNPHLGLGKEVFVAKLSDDGVATGPGYFTFNEISDQQVDIPFEVTLTAKDSNENPDTSFSGHVALASSSVVGPTSVEMVNGTATFTATAYDQGYIKLNASAGGRSGYSNEFNVWGTSLCTSSIIGKVVDLRGDDVYEATVTLTNQQSQGVPITTKSNDYSGSYAFLNQPCGLYYLTAEKDLVDGSSVGTVPLYVSISKSLPVTVSELELPINGSSDDLPAVVLIPGMAGSSTAFGSPYPKLLRTTPVPADRLHLHNPFNAAGWTTITDELWAGGYNTVNCPWDWRLPFDVVYREYLIPCIDDAKKLNSVAAGEKVHVVAHSMGGLVTRAYIQGDDYRGDISKFAIVGTPHLGSPDAYYIWEGGEPKVIDDIKGNDFINFYTNTIQNLGEEAYGKTDFSLSGGKHTEEVHDFVHEFAPSLGQLMSTEALLNVFSEPRFVATTGNKNNDLIALNNDPDIPFLFANTEVENKVHAGLFVGDSPYFSITWINVGVRDDNKPLYKDGEPDDAIKAAGDGTVPYSSATWPESEGWAELVKKTSDVTTDKVEHSELIKEFADEICLFLKKSDCRASTVQAAKALSAVAAGPTSQLAFSLSGGVRVSVTDPAGNKFGYDPVTGEPQEEIPLAEFLFDNEGGGMATESVTDGTYTVSVFGVSNRDYFLDVSYMTETTPETVDLHGFYSGTLVQFEVVIDSTTAPYLTIIPPAQIPVNLQANPAGAAGSGNTVLTWHESTEPGITDYRIYMKGATDPLFSLVDTVAFGTTTYATTDLWALDATNPVKTYYVTAVKSDGSESFFGNAARNNDRDHDGVSDADETANGTNPDMEDTEGDGLSDSEERNYGTDPLMSDTDDDKVGDALETQLGSDPLDDTSLPQAYDDITPDHLHYYLATLGLKVAGIVNGCDGAGQFCPDQLITRDTVAIWLIKAYEGENYTPPNAIGTVFADITIDTFAADFIEDLMVHSGTEGCDTVPNYCPQQTLTKAQAVKMLLKTKYGAGYSPSLPSGAIFNDVTTDTFAAGFIEDLNTEGAAEGCSDTPPLYCPSEMMTRGGFAKMLANTFGYLP